MTKAMRNPDAKHKDFGALIGIIPTNPRFLPSDIDMVYERNQCFLFAEWKRASESFGGGQRILLRRLAMQPRTVVLLVVGDTDDGMNVEQVLYIDPSQVDPVLLGGGFETLKEVIIEWYEAANKVGR
jgi:hypothetical protein